MTWYVIYKTSTGALVSQGDVIANPGETDAQAIARLEAAGNTVVNIGTTPTSGWEWNPVTHQFEAPPSPRIIDKTSFINRMSVAEQRLFLGFQFTSATNGQKQNVQTLVQYLCTIGNLVNLDSPSIQQGINYLSTTNPQVLTPARVAEVLA